MKPWLANDAIIERCMPESLRNEYHISFTEFVAFDDVAQRVFLDYVNHRRYSVTPIDWYGAIINL